MSDQFPPIFQITNASELPEKDLAEMLFVSQNAPEAWQTRVIMVFPELANYSGQVLKGAEIMNGTNRGDKVFADSVDYACQVHWMLSHTANIASKPETRSAISLESSEDSNLRKMLQDVDVKNNPSDVVDVIVPRLKIFYDRFGASFRIEDDTTGIAVYVYNQSSLRPGDPAIIEEYHDQPMDHLSYYFKVTDYRNNARYEISIAGEPDSEGRSTGDFLATLGVGVGDNEDYSRYFTVNRAIGNVDGL